ncbi:MAG: hypothetical protein ABSC48_13440 [Terracidiphilus sp.]|jgi:hypothetical protein
MVEFIDNEVQSLALSLNGDAVLPSWHQKCDSASRTYPFTDIVIREYTYFHENRFSQTDSSDNKNEKKLYPEKGLQLICVERGDAGQGKRGSSSGWKLYLLESGKLLLVDFEVESDVTAGWSLGYDEDLYDYQSVQTEMENDLDGLQSLFARIEDIRRQVRTKAYREWETRQGFIEEWRNQTDALGDWLEAKRSLDIPDEVWI